MKETWYIVHFDNPSESNGDYMRNFKTPAEFATLERAKEYAKDMARYGNAYVAKIENIFEYKNEITETSL